MYLKSVLQLKGAVVNTAVVIPLVSFLIKFLDPLLSLTTRLDRELDLRSTESQNQDTSFDFIIVGSGSAGSILASRLSENASLRVLLLEAGGIPSPILGLPTLAFHFNNKPSHDWAHRTVPQRRAALGLNGRVSNWPSGKTLGGSSSINGLIYIRGNVQGYDLIANRTGDSLWRMKNILKFYKKLENYNGWFDKGSHGRHGSLSIESPTIVPLTKYFLRAGQELGYNIRDPNIDGKHKEGFAPIESYLRNGARSDAYTSPLKQSLKRPNLILRKYSFVTKLQFKSGSQSQVVGVEYERHGKVYFATSTKETILAAGALSTPKILMLSGIGPREHLAQMNIPLRVNLPVGQRLQDKYGALIGPFIVPKGFSFDMDRDVNISSSLRWLVTGRGLLNSGRTEATFSIYSEIAQQTGDIHSPDIHSYLFSQTPSKPEDVFGSSFNINQQGLDYMKKSSAFGDGFFQLVTLSRGIGTGFVRLYDTNPHSPLIIDPKYLENPHDVKKLVQGVRFAVNVVEKTNAMHEIQARLFTTSYPGCENYVFKSDNYFECVARHATITAYKYCGTASIGDRNDPEAVIDSRFRVFGTTGLRVIDGSVFRINEVNTNDVTMRMIGELGAHVIQQSLK